MLKINLLLGSDIVKFFDPVILLTSEYNGISKGSRGYFIESVSDRVCTVLFNY